MKTPNSFLNRAKTLLHLEKEDISSIVKEANIYQRQFLPGKPSITLAAFIYMKHLEKTKQEISDVFGINVKSLTARMGQINRSS